MTAGTEVARAPGPASPPLLHNVQLLRLIAASAVLFSHAADRIVGPRAPVWAVPWTAGVDAFFVVSGFIMAYVAGDRFGTPGAARWFLTRRLIRIVPPYWFFTLVLAGVIGLAGGRIDNSVADAPSLAASLGFVPWPRVDGKLNPILAQGWTLNYEMAFYLVFAVALASRRGLGWLVAALAIVAIAHPFIPARWFMPRFWSAPVILDFAAGLVLAILHRRGWRAPGWRGAALLAGAVVLFVAAPRGWGPRGSASSAAILVAAAFVLAPDPPHLGRVRRWLALGGGASYALYLSHMLVVAAVIVAWRRLGLGAPWLELACAFVAAQAFALVFYLVAERPAVTALSRRLGRRPPREDVQNRARST